jgi:hypothetical protein
MDDKDGCSNQYARAREIQAQGFVEDLIEIADDSSNDYKELANGRRVVDQEVVSRSRLRWDARRWHVSKVLPKFYGDKLDLTHAGAMDLNITEVRRVIVDAAAPTKE